MNCTAYLRVSTDKQFVENQRHEIERYCEQNNLTITNEIAVNVSSRKTLEQRQVTPLLSLPMGSIIVVAELSRLGRNTAEVILLVEELLHKGIALHIIRQGMKLTKHDPMSRMMITMFSCFAQLERDFISERTKAALARKKAEGVKLGRKSTGKYEKDHRTIVRLRREGKGYGSIAEILGLSKQGVKNYILKHKIKKG